MDLFTPLTIKAFESFENTYTLYDYFTLPPPNYLIGKLVSTYYIYIILSFSIVSSSLLITSNIKTKKINKYMVSIFDENQKV
jgi:hypothetical protein